MRENTKKLTRKLTRKQLITLDMIRMFIREHEYSPTYKEIAEMVGTTTCSAFNIVLRLQEKGYITMTNSKQRTIRVVDQNDWYS